MSAPVEAAVIDASVALKWVFNDEEVIEAAFICHHEMLPCRSAWHNGCR